MRRIWSNRGITWASRSIRSNAASWVQSDWCFSCEDFLQWERCRSPPLHCVCLVKPTGQIYMVRKLIIRYAGIKHHIKNIHILYVSWTFVNKQQWGKMMSGWYCGIYFASVRVKKNYLYIKLGHISFPLEEFLHCPTKVSGCLIGGEAVFVTGPAARHTELNNFCLRCRLCWILHLSCALHIWLGFCRSCCFR